MLEKVLQQLGLTNKEQVVYKLILEHGKIAPARVSRLAGINRTTVYSVAKELKDKGLIIEDLGGKTLYYLPAREEELEKIIKNEQERVTQKEHSIRDLQEFLKNSPGSETYSVPKIRFIEGDDIEHYFREVLPRWLQSMLATDPTWWGFQDHTLIEEFEDMIDWSWEKIPKEVDLKLFTNESYVEKRMKDKQYAERRHMKFWDTNQFSASQWIAGDYVIFAMTKQKPYYLVEIHDSVMAHNLREVFKKLWEKI